MFPGKYSGCHLIYFSIIKDIKPAARGPTLSVFFFLFPFLFAGSGARPRLLSFLSFFPAAGDGDKSEKKIQTVSIVGRWDAIFRLPGDKNLINGHVVLKFKKGIFAKSCRKTFMGNNNRHCSRVNFYVQLTYFYKILSFREIMRTCSQNFYYNFLVCKRRLNVRYIVFIFYQLYQLYKYTRERT